MIDRIAKLLHKAERAATPEEAQIYFDKAQSLATTYSISLAKARLHSPERTRARPMNKTVTIGAARLQANRHLVTLFHAVALANDLKMDVAHNSTYVIVYGFEDDIVAAEQLWTRISTQMIRFGEAYLATDVWRGEDRFVYTGTNRGWRAMTKQAARATYYSAFIETVAKRIQLAREESVRVASERDSQPQDGGEAATSTQLALRAKEVAVQDFYLTTTKARGSWRGGRGARSTASQSARVAGARDGRRASLHDTTGLRGPGPALPS